MYNADGGVARKLAGVNMSRSPGCVECGSNDFCDVADEPAQRIKIQNGRAIKAIKVVLRSFHGGFL